MRRFFKRFSPQSWTILTNLGVAQLVTLLIGVGSSSLWAHHVSKEVFGQYQLILSLVKLVGSFCLSGLDTSVSLSAAKGQYGNLIKIFNYKLIATLVGSLVLGGMAFYYGSNRSAISIGLMIAALIFPFYETQKVWIHWLRGRKQLNLFAYLDISRALLSFLILWLLIIMNQRQLNVLLAGVMGASAIFSVGVTSYIFKKRENQKQEKETIRYGFHATAATLLGGLVLTDKAIINEHLSVEQIAVYSIALLFPEQIRTFYSIFNQMMIPQLSAAKDVRSAWQYLKPKLPLLISLFFLVGITGFFLMPVVIPLVFSEKYRESIPYAKWLWLSFAVTVPATYLGTVLRTQRKLRFLYLFEMLNPLIPFVLFFVLISHGLWGIVTARMAQYVFSSLFFALFLFYYLNREKRISSPI